jgi:voltage-gated potassium channel
MANQKLLINSAGYQLFMLVLCIYGLATVAAEVIIKLNPEVRQLLDYSDFMVCMIFLADFAVSLWHAPNRWAYFRKWGWLDLLSSIPSLDVGRWGRIARVVRVFRVLRGLRTARIVTDLLVRRKAENTLLALSLVVLLLIVFCSVAILQFETDPDSNLKTAEDALWWSLNAITSVGGSNHYPVTIEGRFVAGLLKLVGVGLFSTFSGFLAAWFLAPVEEAEESELEALRLEIAALRESLERTASGAKS